MRLCLSLLLAFTIVATASGQTPSDEAPSAEDLAAVMEAMAAFEQSLNYQTGQVSLSGGMATIDVPAAFRFLDAAGASRLLVDGWGNPPGAADGVLGMLIPADLSPMADEGWGVVVTFEETGYVDDADAASLDFDDLLGQMQAGSESENAARAEQGFETIRLVGWAEPPSYDSSGHKLYWAKELEFGGSPDHTLNYCIRFLGRRGVLELNAVSAMGQLGDIRSATGSLLTSVAFNEGHRYEDYVPGVDKAATYGVAGLIAGAAAAKAGLFKGLIVAILAAKKLLIVGGIAAVAFLAKLFGGKKDEAAG
ncbi:MAG: DUF2167 domain-containing protein [Planctomycetota bacterium]